jgi:hypothetical protein
MKKLLLIFIIGLISLVGVFGETETWMSVGFESGNFFEHTSDSGILSDSYMSSPRMTLSSYTFWNKKNIGLFVHDSFLFPNAISTTINGITTDVDLGIYDTIMQLFIIIGPGFRYNFDKNLKLHYGIGFSFLETIANYSIYSSYYGGTISYNMAAFNFGIGSDVGLKYDISDSLYFDGGTIINYDFKNHTTISSSFGDASGWSNNNYRMISIRPYISFGFNFYKTNDGLGKLKS